jgi:hypothetical protein
MIRKNFIKTTISTLPVLFGIKKLKLKQGKRPIILNRKIYLPSCFADLFPNGLILKNKNNDPIGKVVYKKRKDKLSNPFILYVKNSKCFAPALEYMNDYMRLTVYKDKPKPGFKKNIEVIT